MGAQLQVAIFINEGQLADVFEPGRYELTTENLPILTKLKSWKYGFNSPFKAEVYFINTRRILCSAQLRLEQGEHMPSECQTR